MKGIFIKPSVNNQTKLITEEKTLISAGEQLFLFVLILFAGMKPQIKLVQLRSFNLTDQIYKLTAIMLTLTESKECRERYIKWVH